MGKGLRQLFRMITFLPKLLQELPKALQGIDFGIEGNFDDGFKISDCGFLIADLKQLGIKRNKVNQWLGSYKPQRARRFLNSVDAKGAEVLCFF